MKRKGLKLRYKYERPGIMMGTTWKLRLGCGNVYITVNRDDEGFAREVFMRLGKSGSCQNCLVASISRIVSIALQEGIQERRLAKTIVSMVCQEAQPGEIRDENRLTSCVDGLAKILMGKIKSC